MGKFAAIYTETVHTMTVIMPSLMRKTISKSCVITAPFKRLHSTISTTQRYLLLHSIGLILGADIHKQTYEWSF